MSTSPETDFDLELHFLPAWAKKAPSENRYEHFAGEGERPERGRGPRGERGRRREDQPRRPRDGRDQGRGGPPRGGPRRPHGRDDQRERPERPRPAPAPLPDITVAFIPDDKGVESLARQIKMTGQAHSLFGIAEKGL